MTADRRMSNRNKHATGSRRTWSERSWLHLRPIRTKGWKLRVLPHAVYSMFGSTALALLSSICFLLSLNFATTAFVLLIVIVLLALRDGLVSSVTFSAVATACLVFLFVEPVYSSAVDEFWDLIPLAAFLSTSLVIVSLIRRLRMLERAHGEQANLLDLTTNAIFLRNTDHVIVYWNRGAEELYGWTREEAVGTVADELLQTAFPAPRLEIDTRLLQTGRWQGELIHTTRCGKKVIVASRWSTQYNDLGLTIGTLESNTDVTECRRAEDALRRVQAAYLTEAQRLSHTGSFGWNVSSGELFWSDETFRIFDVERTLSPSLNLVLERTHPDDVAAVRQAIGRAARERHDFSHEHRLLLKNGEIRHIRVVARGTTDDQGQFQFIGAVMDVTAQKKAHSELERSEQRYRHLFSRMPIALRQLDASKLAGLFKRLRAEGVTDLGSYFDSHPEFLYTCMEALSYQESNQRFIQMFGGPGANVVRPITHSWKERPDTFRRAMESRFRGEASFEEETRMVTWDGRVIDVLFITARVGPINDSEVSLVGTIDISQRLRVQERLRQVQAEFAHAARVSMLGELTASIAHEVNQPLAAIATNGAASLRWLARPNPNLAEVHEGIENMIANARRAANIVARIHAMASRKAPERTFLLLDDVIRESLLFVRHEMESRSVTILHRSDPTAPQVLGDRTQLQQVIVNLAINAMQAMMQTGSECRKIVISTARHDSSAICCSVEDSGPGLGAEQIDRLFESFFTTKDSGMGMGLPICRSIVEAHGGEIGADAHGAEGGARFWFALPVPASTVCE
ncbi:ATP-binding protein [Bradyrhizobium sp. HKCCYLS1011]|uniref:ATP-binding protein n=1 Tax=Bradyrhizobium sp. HKCCYLS1011 TaxID=3420733 RepID=UPI003EB81C47